MDYQRIKDTDFTSAEGLKGKHDEIISASQTIASSQSTVTPTTTGEGEISKYILKPTDAELNLLFESLSMAGTKPAILSLIPKYSDKYIPKTSLPEYPLPLTELHKPEHLELSYHELLKLCEIVSVVVTEVNARAVEKETKVQHKTKLWHKYRAGRVTASRMKAVCCTDVSNPSQSLIKNICYPDAFVLQVSKQRMAANMRVRQKRGTSRVQLKTMGNLKLLTVDLYSIQNGHGHTLVHHQMA